jgi:hypothetical protein
MQFEENLRNYFGTIPNESEYKKRIRCHQGWWRSFVLNEEQGKNPIRTEEKVCNTILGGEISRHNFLSETVFKSVEQTILERKEYEAGLFNQDRLFNNLLSSQPLAFNFFGELKQDYKLAKKAISCFIPNLTRVTNVLFEFAPKENYISDNSAFDIALEIEINGKTGLFGLECKYTDSFSAKEYTKENYKKIFNNSANFKEPYEKYIQSRYNQLFRNQLIAESLIQNNNYSFVFTGLFCFQGDTEAIETGKAFQTMLNNGPESFKIISYSDFISALQKQELTWQQREFTMLLWARYCGLELSEKTYKKINTV